MKIVLKNVKYNATLSEETNNFSATIYVDGVKAGVAMNRGHGAPNIYHWDNLDLGKKLEAFAAEQVKDFKFEQLDIFLDRELGKFLVRKKLKSLVKKDVVFRFKGDPKGEWRLFKGEYNTITRAAMAHRYGDKLELVANADLEAAVTFDTSK